jgi:hypothetical protein
VAVVFRLASALQFDIAAEAGLLILAHGRARDQCIESGAEIAAANRHAVSGPGSVQLPAVGEAVAFVE